MLVVAVILLLSGIATCVVSQCLSIAAFRRLVDYQFEHHHPAWVECGRPLGGAATRKQAGFWTSDLATILCHYSWMGARPSWLPPDSVGEQERLRSVKWFATTLVGVVLFGAGVLALVRFAP